MDIFDGIETIELTAWDMRMCLHANLKADAHSVAPVGRAVSQLEANRRVPMPFYQVLCIAAHNPEYVRSYNIFSNRLILIFTATN